MELKLNYPIPHKIHIIAHKLQLRTEKLFAEKFGISFNGYTFLHILVVKGSQSQQTISALSGVTPAAASKRIQFLIEKGYVKIETNPQNKRENIVSITTKGKNLAKKATIAITDDFNSLFGNFEGKKEFENLLDQMIIPLLNNSECNL